MDYFAALEMAAIEIMDTKRQIRMDPFMRQVRLRRRTRHFGLIAKITLAAVDDTVKKQARIFGC